MAALGSYCRVALRCFCSTKSFSIVSRMRSRWRIAIDALQLPQLFDCVLSRCTHCAGERIGIS